MADNVHKALDIAGFIPGIGSFSEGVNSLLYAFQGEKGEAALAALSAIPGIKAVKVLKGGIQYLKIIPESGEAGKALKELYDVEKTAGNTGHVIEVTAESGKAVELLRTQSVNLERLNNIVDEHLTDMDFSGTLRDLKGNPVSKLGGGYWKHLQEMKDSYSGLLKIKRGLEGSLKNPNLSDGARQALQNELDKANSNISKIEDLFKPFGGI
ncbi:polymorphic toxin type 28 domain-containing protein [Pectinatus frisingensis]|uniref:polymorphic toxin type 28 domain-containing protein n=2 Tax=Pectinatus frisingensis TaxID=865 RepID=UPI003D80190B